MSIRVVIVTEDPPAGEKDYAPKEFTAKRQVATVLGILSDAMGKIVSDGGKKVLQYAGRDIISVTITQEKGE
jgi:hypothetical protein